MTVQSKLISFMGAGAPDATFSVTGVGFVPTGIIFFTAGHISAGANSSYVFGFGATVGVGAANNFGVGGVEINLAGGVFSRRNTDQKCIHMVTHSGALESITASATLVSFDADGFTLDYSVATFSRQMFALCLGGDAVLEMDQYTTPTATGADVRAGVFTAQPDALIYFTGGDHTLNIPAQGAISHSFGMATAAADQYAMGFSSLSTSNPTGAQRSGRAGRVISIPLAGADWLAADLTSIDATGHTVNWTTINATGRHICALAISGVNAKVLSDAAKIATAGTQGYTGAGFTPESGLFFTGSMVGTGIGSDLRAGFGAATDLSTSEVGAAAFATADGDAWPASVSRFHSVTRGVVMMTDGDATPTIDAAANVDSWDADGMTLDWLEVDPALAFSFGALLLGSVAVTAPSVALTGTLAGATEAAMAAGGLTAIFTLTGGIYVATLTADHKTALIDAMYESSTHANDIQLQAAIAALRLLPANIVRTASDVVTVTFAASSYDLRSDALIGFVMPESLIA